MAQKSTKKRADEQILEGARIAQSLEQKYSQELEDSGFADIMSTDEMAAHYLMMNYDQRTQLFREVLISHGATEGLKRLRHVYQKATELYRGEV